MGINPKQETALYYLTEDKEKTTIVYGGAAGGGKSWLGCYWITLMCLQYPGIRCVIGRKELKVLKATTLLTLWDVMYKGEDPDTGLPNNFGLIEGKDFKYDDVDSEIVFFNEETGKFDGSKIFLLNLEYQPKDAEYKRFGSYEISFAFMDEANELLSLAVDIINSRRRYKLSQYGLIPKTLLTCNPDKGFIKTQFYTPYKNAQTNIANKNDPTWEPLYEMMPFEVFIPAKVDDNPKVDSFYKQNLLNMKDEASKQRLLYGMWDYDDKPGQLVLSTWFQDALRIPEKLSNKRRGGIDMAREGKDKTVVTIWNDNHIEEIQIVNIDPLIPNYAGRCADFFIPFFITRGIGGKDVYVDGIFDAGIIDAFAERHFYVNVFKSSDAAIPIPGDKRSYQNRRSQSYWLEREGFQNGIITINPYLKYVDDLYDDLSAHLWEEKNNKIVILPKEDIKLVLGRSPDFSDSGMMSFFPSNTQIAYAFGENPFGEQAKSRIAFS